MPFGLLGLAGGILAHRPALGTVLFAWALVIRWTLSFAVGMAVVQDRSWFGLLVLYPIRDLMGFFFWAASYLSNRIVWRGRIFELLPGGRMRTAK
jgi:ceramide glucosyltransferase